MHPISDFKMLCKKQCFVVYLFYTIILPVLSIKFYEGLLKFEYDCSVKLDPTREFTCACLSGVWKIYKSECEELITIAGQDYCFDLPSEVNVIRAERVLESVTSLSIRKKEGTLVEVEEEQSVSLNTEDIITTGDDWSFSGSDGRVFCVSPQKNYVCQFGIPENFAETKFGKGCSVGAIKLPHHECVYVENQNENICENSLRFARSPQKQLGRMFLFAPGNNVTIINDPTKVKEEDEDFYDKGNTTVSLDSISTEIWNFIDKGLDKILKLGPINKLDKKLTRNDTNYSKVSIYHLLQLSRDVMKKTCPDFYVRPQFLDMAIYTFIELQKKAVQMQDFPTEYSGYMRIVNALKNCTANSPVYPFVNDFSCTADGEPSGVYRNAMNETNETNILYDAIPTTREPIIETVWKIFYNAHSHCYQYFDESQNDHHRYAAWITPLFENGINDIWLNGSSSNNVFGNMFGNMMNIQTRISYCTAYSRLESEYPWDLPIPPKIELYSDSVNISDTPAAPPPASSRRKRSVENPGQCFEPTKLSTC